MKVFLYADNVAIFLNGSASQFNNAFDTLNAFGQKSGCKVNMDKSSAFYVGCSSAIKLSRATSLRSFNATTKNLYVFVRLLRKVIAKIKQTIKHRYLQKAELLKLCLSASKIKATGGIYNCGA